MLLCLFVMLLHRGLVDLNACSFMASWWGCGYVHSNENFRLWTNKCKDQREAKQSHIEPCLLSSSDLEHLDIACTVEACASGSETIIVLTSYVWLKIMDRFVPPPMSVTCCKFLTKPLSLSTVYSNALQESANSILYNGLIEELVDVLQITDKQLMVRHLSTCFSCPDLLVRKASSMLLTLVPSQGIGIGLDCKDSRVFFCHFPWSLSLAYSASFDTDWICGYL